MSWMTQRELFNKIKGKRNQYAQIPEVYLAEISGQDSVAAIDWILSTKHPKKIIPVAIHHRGLFGEPEIEQKNIEFLWKKYPTSKEIIDPVIFLDFSEIFDKIILRTMGQLQQEFEFFSPCPPCHLFLHLVRIPLCRFLGITKIITGERESHDGKIKINQLPEILDYFVTLLQTQYNIQLMQPLRHLQSNNEIKKQLGNFWSTKSPQTKCIFSGNYLNLQNEPINLSHIWLTQLTEFYGPKLHTEIFRTE